MEQYHFLICFYHHKYSPIFSSITKKKKTLHISLCLSLSFSLSGLYHIFTKNSTRFWTIVSCLSDTLVLCVVFFFFLINKIGRVGPETKADSNIWPELAKHPFNSPKTIWIKSGQSGWVVLAGSYRKLLKKEREIMHVRLLDEDTTKSVWECQPSQMKRNIWKILSSFWSRTK